MPTGIVSFIPLSCIYDVMTFTENFNLVINLQEMHIISYYLATMHFVYFLHGFYHHIT